MKRMNKKIVFGLLILMLLFTGCGGKSLQMEADGHAELISDPIPSEIDTPAEETDTVESEETNASNAAEEAAKPETPKTGTANSNIAENKNANSNTNKPSNTASDTTSNTESGSWFVSDKTNEFDTETVLKHGDVSYSNFNDMVSVGINSESNVVSTIETEIGFILSVVDNDTVKVTFYNYCTEYVKPVKVTAERIRADFVDESGDREYIIDGYDDCPNGVGRITMELSNGKELQAVVFRDSGITCVANISRTSDAVRYHEYRLLSKETRERFHVTPENSTFTSPIYYPIVPLNDKEKLDVEPWIKLSNELVESDWTDARKVATYYRWLIENVAYDYWLVYNTDVNLRAKYYHDYTGTWNVSKTRVGICHDYAQILAIMCRAQGIPAVVLGDHGWSPHGWNDIYLSDYNRWISVDCTPDAMYGCYSEDYEQWRVGSSSKVAYCHFDNDNGRTNIDEVWIGNIADMKRQDVDMPYYE